MGFGIMEIIFPMLTFLFFAIFIGTFIFIIYTNVKKGIKNNNSPRLTSSVTVLDKRMKVWGDHSRTTYYITFEVESGDRMELEVPDNEYGLIVEGDKGKLTFQGTRFLEFKRGL